MNTRAVYFTKLKHSLKPVNKSFRQKFLPIKKFLTVQSSYNLSQYITVYNIINIAP